MTGVDNLAGSGEIGRWLQTLAEHAPSFLTVVDGNGRVIATGRTAQGFGSILGRSIFEFIETGSHEAVRAALAKVLVTGQSTTYEASGFGEDGSAGHIWHVQVVPLGEPGKVEAIVLIPTDITERVKLERTVIESEQTLRLAVEATRIGLWRWDIAEDRVRWDDRLLEIWELSETPPDYEAYRRGLHPDDRQRVEQAIQQALETGRYPTLEHRIVCGGGREKHLLAVGSVATNDQGKPVRLMGGVLDITEQKRLEAQLSRAVRVEAIGQLTAGIAHNFNNLLSVVIPNLELVLAQRDSRELATALEAALQARDVVRGLLSLARDRGDAAGVADCREVIARAVAICRVTFPREIRLQSSIEDGVRPVRMSATELEQVLLNLLLNARDAVQSVAHREVQVIADRVIEARAMTRIRVIDNGIGMSPELRAHIFEPFFTTKPPHQGSGLGLAHALLRVQRAGGRLDCTSAPGEGTTFEVLIPEADHPPISEPPTPTARPSKREVILIVDDEPMVRTTLRRLLEVEGYVTHEAASAAEAIAMLKREAADLIILDQSMPEQTGLQALPSIRAVSQAPVILFSGMLPDSAPGVAAMFEKPARPAELWRLVRQVLDASERR